LQVAQEGANDREQTPKMDFLAGRVPVPDDLRQLRLHKMADFNTGFTPSCWWVVQS